MLESNEERKLRGHVGRLHLLLKDQKLFFAQSLEALRAWGDMWRDQKYDMIVVKDGPLQRI